MNHDFAAMREDGRGHEQIICSVLATSPVPAL
jgi:hypothetical protein